MNPNRQKIIAALRSLLVVEAGEVIDFPKAYRQNEEKEEAGDPPPKKQEIVIIYDNEEDGTRYWWDGKTFFDPLGTFQTKHKEPKIFPDVDSAKAKAQRIKKDGKKLLYIILRDFDTVYDFSGKVVIDKSNNLQKQLSMLKNRIRKVKTKSEMSITAKQDHLVISLKDPKPWPDGYREGLVKMLESTKFKLIQLRPAQSKVTETFVMVKPDEEVLMYLPIADKDEGPSRVKRIDQIIELNHY